MQLSSDKAESRTAAPWTPGGTTPDQGYFTLAESVGDGEVHRLGALGHLPNLFQGLNPLCL